MYFEENELFQHWVSQEIQHFKQTDQITQPNQQSDENGKWTSLITNGFISKLFEQIDYQYFTKQSCILNNKQMKRQNMLRQYWLGLNEYMQKRHNKRINPQYLSKQVNQKKQLTSRDYSCKSVNLMESSIIQLLKLQFYLLVQKHKKYQQTIEQQQQDSHQQILTAMDQTLQQSAFRAIDQSSFSIQQSELEVQRSSIPICESIMVESTSQCQDNVSNNEFVHRVCQLPNQVQEYLMLVVQSIQQNQIIESLQSINNQQNTMQTLAYNQVRIPVSPSNQNFKKIIYRQIQHASQQNQQLKQKIQQILQENYKLQKEIQDNLQQQNILITKINNYNQQKEQLFLYLKKQHSIPINSLQQFIQVVKHLQQENQLLENTIGQIQERNYELQQSNAQKVHSINKNALQITKINQEITKFKTKITGLKEDINYLDEFVNGNTNTLFNAQLVTSINLEDQFQDEDQFSFNKSIDLQARHSFGNVLRENNDIYNQKVLNKSNKQKHNRVLTDSITGYGPNRLSLQASHKPSTHKKTHKSNFPHQSNQQNIDPTPFQQDQLKMDNFSQYPSKSHSHISVNFQHEEQEREIQEEKQKYKQQLVTSLQQLYKEIADLTKDVTQVKEQNKVIQKRNKVNEKKINQLKSLHQAFIKEAYKP